MTAVSAEIIGAALYVASGMVLDPYKKEEFIDAAMEEYSLEPNDITALNILASGFLAFGNSVRRAERENVKILGTDMNRSK